MVSTSLQFVTACFLPWAGSWPGFPRWWTVTWQTKYKPFVPRLRVVTVFSTAAEGRARTHSFGDVGRRCTRRTTEDRVEGRNTTERWKFLLSKTNRTSQLTKEQKGRLWYLLGLGLLGKLIAVLGYPCDDVTPQNSSCYPLWPGIFEESVTVTVHRANQNLQT